MDGRKEPSGECQLNIGSMYGIFPYMLLQFIVNVGTSSIHGSYG